MSSDDLTLGCILVKGVPKHFSVDQVHDLINKEHLILHRHRVHEEDNDSKTWILQINLQDADELCDTIQRRSIDVDDDTLCIVFERAQSSDIPEDWTDQGTSAFIAMSKSTGGARRDKEHGLNTTLCQIKVTGLPEAATEKDYLQLYFEEKENFNNHELHVESIKIDEQNSAAIIKFADPKDAAKVLEIRQLDIEETMVHATALTEKELNALCTVQVRGHKDIVNGKNLSILRMYFQNTNRSGGGKVVNYCIQAGVAYFTFETAEVADRVIARGRHMLRDFLLEVKQQPFIIPNEADNIVHNYAIVISPIPENVDEQYLILYFDQEELFGEMLQVEAVKFSEDKNSAVVAFSNKNSVSKILPTQLIMDNQSINVKVYDPEEDNTATKCTIAVTGAADMISTKNLRSLKTYFQNIKLSGGGSISYCSIKFGVAYFIFMDEYVAKRVAERASHSIRSQPVNVTLLKDDGDTGRLKKPHTSTVTVSGLPTNISEDYLSLCIENTSGIPVKSVKMENKRESALVEFEQCEGVDSLIHHGQLRLKETVVRVSPGKSERDILNTIEVRGQSPIKNDMETLEQYFQSERHSGGGKIVDFSLDSVTDVAYFTFENETVASRVAEREHSRRGLQVKLLSGTIYHRDEKAKMNSGTSVVSSEETKTVKVVDEHKDVLSTDILTFYFENEFRSGGGQIEMIRLDDVDEHITYVTFLQSTVAKVVAEKQHNLRSHKLLVSLYYPPPFLDNKVLVKRLAPKTTKESLFNFLEAKTGIKALTMTLHMEEDDVALVTMESEIDFQRLEIACSQHTLEGSKLQVSRVPVSKCIQVDNLAANTTSDTVWYYFENKTKSEIDHVMIDETSSSCVVCFKEYEVISAILGHTYMILGEEVSVSTYFNCIKGPDGGTEERVWRLPNPIKIKDIEQQKIKFCTVSDRVREDIESELKKSHTVIVWPSESNRNMWLNCSLDRNVPDCFRLASAWPTLAKKTFYNVMTSIDLCKINVQSNLWDKFMSYLKDAHVQNPERVAIFLDQKPDVVIVGQCSAVKNLAEDMKRNIKRLEKEEMLESQHMKDALQSLHPVELKLLKKLHIVNELERQFKHLQVRTDDVHGDIIFEGPRMTVESSKDHIKETINAFAFTRTENIPNMKATLYQSKETTDFIQGHLEANDLMSVWDVEGTRLSICCAPDSDVGECERIILTSVVEERKRYERGSIPVLATGEFERKMKDIEKSFKGKVEIAICRDADEVEICATKDVFPSVLQEVERYIYSNTKVSKTIAESKEVIMLIDKYYKKEFLGISHRFQTYYIEIVTMENYEGFEIRGLEAGIEAATDALQNIVAKVKVKRITISKLGVTDYVRSAKGKDSIHTLESSLECAIRVERDADGDTSSGILASCKLKGRQNIYAWIGDMTEDLNVDGLVTPQDTQLSLLGALGAAVLSKGGHSIQQACSDRIAKHGELREGEAFISDAGNMDAKFIVHMISPEWEDGMENEKERLIDSVINCLHQADHRKRAQSIAIPAIGCGNNKFPVNISTTCIVQAVERFFSQTQNNHLRNVYLCDKKMNTAYCFAQSLASVFGIDKVRLYDKDVTGEMENAEGELIKPYQDTTRPKSPSQQKASRSLYPSPTDVAAAGMPACSDEMNKVQFGDVTVSFVYGEIAKQQVNAIVNTTSADLDLTNGSVSQSLLDTGGQGLQQEINAKYPNGIKSTQIAVTAGHKLNCDTVLHIALGDFGKNSVKELNKTMKGCLDEVKRRRFSSVAFPALGTGMLGFPRDLVAKEMFKAVSEFSKKQSNSIVKDVRFVVYHKDYRTIHAFKTELSNFTAVGNTTKKHHYSKQNYQQMQQSQIKCPDQSSDMFGNVMVSAKEGDLTIEHVDCIVNSTNLDLDFSTGEVSQVLQQKCGKGFLEQVEAGKAEMKQKHFIKTSAPGLPCKRILHIDGLTSNWHKTVVKCLKEADRINMTSIAFPALGAGLKGFDIQRIAQDVMNGVGEFANSQPKNLKDVRFLLFDIGVLEDYRNAIHEASERMADPGLFGKLLSGVKNVFGMSGAESDQQNVPQNSQQQPDVDTVRFVIFATSESVIDDAVEKLHECIEKDIHTKTFDDNIIKSLDKPQILEIEATAKQHRVHAEIDTSKSIIKIIGISENVLKAGAKVQSLLSDAVQMDYLRNIAQWYAIYSKGGSENVEPYEKDVNLQLERSYKRGLKTVAISNAYGPVVVDFETLEEYPEFNNNIRSKVIRRDLLTNIGYFACPLSWGEMDVNLKVVNLRMSDSEYINIDSEFKSCSMAVGNCVVMKIERIQNKTLWEQYHSKKKQLEEKNQPGTTIERHLWHGTKATSVDSINAHGFNRSYCGQNATLYGAGVYFDTGSSYAWADTYSVPDDAGVKRVYYCRVLTGEYTLGDEKKRVLPKNTRGGPDCIFDSVVDHVSNPELFVIFHDSQAYPEYLVTFQIPS